MLNTNQFVKKAGSYQLAQVNGVSDPTLMAVATEYRTAISRKYQVVPQHLLNQTFSGSTPVHCSVKYDGEQVFILFDAAKNLCFAFNAPSGRCRTGLPYLRELENHLRQKQVTKALLVGESYLQSPSNRSTKIADVIRATFAGDQASQDHLTLGIYDIIMLDGKKFFNPSEGFERNNKALEVLFSPSSSARFHRVQGATLPAEKVIEFFHKSTQVEKEEGVVIRSMSHASIYKLKPLLTVDAAIIGYTEGDCEGHYGVTSLLCGLYDDQTKQAVVLGRIGSGFADEERVRLLSDLSQSKVNAPLNMTDSSGRPVSFVRPQLVVEVEGESLVSETSLNQPVQAQLLAYDASSQSYQFKGMCSFPTLTHMRFLRVRNDKNWQDGGTRPEQISKINLVSQVPSLSTTGEAPEIIERHVYSKKTPKGESIRKACIVQTNSPQKYPYLVHWTDFSPGRKVPLETSIEVATVRERANQLLQRKLAEEIKKGWNKV